MSIPKLPLAFRSDGDALVPENDSAKSYVTMRHGNRVVISESEHSLLQHGAFFAFTESVWHDHWTGKFPVYENFRYFLSVSVGYCDLKMQLTPGGEWVKVLKAKSWSMPVANQQTMNTLTNLISEWVKRNHGYGFDEWKTKHPEGHRSYRHKGKPYLLPKEKHANDTAPTRKDGIPNKPSGWPMPNSEKQGEGGRRTYRLSPPAPRHEERKCQVPTGDSQSA